MSTFPPVSTQISSAVVFRWISGFAGLSNCIGMKLFLCSLRICSALLIAQFQPAAANVLCAAGDVIAAMNAFAASGDFALDMTIASYGV